MDIGHEPPTTSPQAIRRQEVSWQNAPSGGLFLDEPLGRQLPAQSALARTLERDGAQRRIAGAGTKGGIAAEQRDLLRGGAPRVATGDDIGKECKAPGIALAVARLVPGSLLGRSRRNPELALLRGLQDEDRGTRARSVIHLGGANGGDML